MSWTLMSGNYFIRALLWVVVQLAREHEQYDDTAELPRKITVPNGRSSQLVSTSPL